MKKQLAIKGHETRGKEVIEIFKMLGANNKNNYTCSYSDSLYVLNENDNDIDIGYAYDNREVFKLEEFLEKYPYKVGDKVYLDNKLCSIIWMCWECNNIYYTVQGIIDDMFTKKVTADKLTPYKEGVSLKDNKDPLHELCEDICENKLSALMIDSEVCKDEVEIILNDYEIEVRDGKTYAVKKKPKYPSSYAECCEYLGCDDKINTKKLVLFSQLINARNAYWKIAGKEMELDKSWVPDWEDNYEKKYIIGFYQDEINFTNVTNVQYILSFPTAEMRDAFYENFKELIESCKEFL